ncbi:MAG: biotin-dependent carboxyltransferase family protein [Chitinophagaceae bacterium]|nr:biotin-dependent carboxyltransferase family protein [Chitinophagaceae bacterium]
MSAVIIKAGLLDQLVDLGRKGAQHWGITPGGAMDTYSMQVANCLVGNPRVTAVLELHFPAAAIRFDKPALIAIAGADFGAKLNDIDWFTNTAALIPAGTTLRFTKQLKGARAYLAVKGGWSIAAGLQKPLQKGVSIAYSPFQHASGIKPLPWRASALLPRYTLRLLRGPELDWLTPDAQQALVQHAFTIAPSSNRMGYRLQGIVLEKLHQQELISTAVSRGVLQLLPDGQMILLMADHQTTGGYPRPAVLIQADQPLAAQCGNGETIQFEWMDMPEALQALQEQERDLRILQQACNFRLQEYLCSI